MARAAAPLFHATALAKIGSDDFNDAIRANARRIDVTWRFIEDPGVTNGAIMIVRDTSAIAEDEHRLLVSGTPAPSLRMSATDILAHKDCIEGSDLFFADCYALLSDESGDALRVALDVAGAANVLRCLDIVPHDMSKYVDYATLKKYLAHAEIIIVEAATLASLLQIDLGCRPINRSALESLVIAIRRENLPVRYWFLRFGAGNMQEAAMLHEDSPPMYYETGYVNAVEHAGFGDYVAAWELRKVLEHESCNPQCLSIFSMSSYSHSTQFQSAYLLKRR
jgi:sugar/nucleoside kinase (ribokinase family)